MSTVNQPASSQRSGWIISPLWDTAFFLATPLVALIPAVMVDVSRFDSTHMLLLLAIVAVGHHVPGFVRAYSDPELMARYRGRMLLSPLLLVAAALWMEFNQIPGKALILSMWGVWHFQMQSYGLMRIYDVKKGDISPTTARLDYLMVFTWIWAIHLNNPSWSYQTQRQVYELGVPFLPTSVYPDLGALVLLTALVVSAVYVVHAVRRSRRGEPNNPLKYVLLGSTLIFMLSAYNLTHSIIFVVVIVELVHDLQYYALAWVFQRRLSERQGRKNSMLRLLFQPTPVMLSLYVGLCLVYGAGLSVIGSTHFVVSNELALVIKALLSASVIFHFYTDGFIWKVRQPRTREYLGIEGKQADAQAAYGAPPAWRRSLVHLGLYALILACCASIGRTSGRRSLEISETLARQLPQLGDAHLRLADEYKNLGQFQRALQEYSQAIKLETDQPVELRHRMATAYIALGNYEQAVMLLRDAVNIAPANKFRPVAGELALLLADCPSQELRDGDEAVRLAELACPAKGPKRAQYLSILAASYREAGRYDEAAQTARLALGTAKTRGQTELVPQIEERLNQIERARLTRTTDSAEISTARHQAQQQDQESAEVHYRQGIVLSRQGKVDEAIVHFRKAAKLKPAAAKVHVNLGIALASQGELDEGIHHLREALRIGGEIPQIHYNLGAALVDQGKLDEAIGHFRQAIKLKADYAKAYFQLAVALGKQDRIDEARQHLRDFGSLQKGNILIINRWAWARATEADAEFRDAKAAVLFGEVAAELSDNQNATVLDTLAAAYAAAGQFDRAVSTAEKAIKLASDAGNKQLMGTIDERLKLYRQSRAYRQPAG